MRKVWVLSIFLILLSSCKQQEQKLTIQDDTLINILVDLHIAEEMVNKFRMNQRDSARTLYLDEISQIHKYSKEEINSNVSTLQSNPDKAFKIYQDVYRKLDRYGKNNAKTKEEKKDKTSKDEENKDSTMKVIVTPINKK